MPNPNINRRAVFGITKFTSDATELIERMIAAGGNFADARKVLINNFFMGVKSDHSIPSTTRLSTNWGDYLYMTAAHNQSSAPLNWLKDAHNITEVNSPIFTVNKGYTGNSTTMLLDTNFNPNTQGVNYTQNNAQYGFYRLDNAVGAVIDMGSGDGVAVSDSELSARYTGDLFQGRINGVVIGGLLTASNTNSIGLFNIRRNGTTFQSLKNAVVQDARTSVSVAPPTNNMYLMGYNNNGVPAALSPGQYASAYAGGDSIITASLLARTETYLTGVGAI